MDYKECRVGNHNPMSLCEKCPIQDNCPAKDNSEGKTNETR